jgi:hypothetical protein
MTYTQTLEIPADRRILLEVPPQIPTRTVTITFTPALEAAPLHPCPICASKTDPETGNPRFNAETIASIEEGRAMMRGEIPAKRFGSFDEMWNDLIKDDDE